MINLLMGNFPIILQNVIVLRTHRDRNPLRYWKELSELDIWNLVEFFGVCFRDHKLYIYIYIPTTRLD